jgi:hypothetical protein
VGGSADFPTGRNNDDEAVDSRGDAEGLGGILEQAGNTDGALGTASQLGSSVVEMDGHVNGLQKNLDTLRQLQSTLGGKSRDALDRPDRGWRQRPPSHLFSVPAGIEAMPFTVSRPAQVARDEG